MKHSGSSGCKVESVCLNVDAVNTHRDRPLVRHTNTQTLSMSVSSVVKSLSACFGFRERVQSGCSYAWELFCIIQWLSFVFSWDSAVTWEMWCWARWWFYLLALLGCTEACPLTIHVFGGFSSVLMIFHYSSTCLVLGYIITYYLVILMCIFVIFKHVYI